MRREFPDIPLVGVGTVIIENNRVLLGKRGHAPLLGEWSIPGGVLEVGEMLRDAAVREAREETGLAVETGELLGVFDRVLREGERIRYHYVLIDFLCRRISGEPCCGTDADEVRWFSLEELEPLKLAPDTFEVIRKGFSAVSRWLAPTTLDGQTFWRR